jgi:penicillin-binding protein 1C
MKLSKEILSKKSPQILITCGSILLIIFIFSVFGSSGTLLDNTSFSQIIYDRHQQVLRITLSDDQKYRIYTPLDSVNSTLKEAILLKEDKFFYYHPGINAFSLFRAFYQTYIEGGKKIGGSTITMQVARLLYNLNTRTISGKINQIFTSILLELQYSKNDIFEAYINIAPCGGNVEGFAAGSHIYFGKDIKDISLNESLFLSILPQNPSAFHPKSQTFKNSLLEARNRLFFMWQEEYPQSQNDSVQFNLPVEIEFNIPFYAPHFTTALLNKFSHQQKIHSTLDLKLQEDITRLTTRYIQRKKNLGVYNAAALLVDAENMHVLASLGSADFFDNKIAGQVNGTQSRRSPGSTLKPFIYALAMEQGLIHPMTMLKDAPVSFSEYSPDNYEKDFKGPIKAWEALVASRNVPAVTLASKLKNPDIYDLLYEIDIGDLKEKGYYGLSIVLGSAEFSMEELVKLYSILVNDGIYQNLVYTINPNHNSAMPSKKVLSEEVCYLIKDILRKNPNPTSVPVPINKMMNISIAYKTGTSIGFKDCWAISIFDHYVLAVWLGNFNGYGNPAFNGRYLAAPLMFEIIESIMPQICLPDEIDELDYPPETITQINICEVSGQIAHPFCRRQVSTLYIPGKSPISKCHICREIYVNTKTGYRTFKHEGEFIEKQVYEFWPSDLLALFRRAGIPRRVPPPFDPNEDLNLLSTSGIPPEIVSPLQGTQYMLQPGTKYFTQLPLLANVDADVQEVYWFIDEKYIGKIHPDKIQYWSLAPGKFVLGVVDDHGRSDTRVINVGVATN